jgi:hypothetical protein
MLLALASAEARQAPKDSARRDPFSQPGIRMKDRVEAFREALRKLGYVEGQNNIEYRYGDNKSERCADSPAELVHLNVDVIVTTEVRRPALPKKQPLRFRL